MQSYLTVCFIACLYVIHVCIQQGKQAMAQSVVLVSLRVPKELHDSIIVFSNACKQSINRFICDCIITEIEYRKEKDKKEQSREH